MAEELGISLHALTGIIVADTMCLTVTIAGTPLTALVDSGSTHTFVPVDVMRQLGLDVNPRPGLSVKVPSAGVCRNTAVRIADETFAIGCYSLPLTGFDVALSVQWLRTLGPILWNFQALTMTFWRNKTVRLQGIGGTPTHASTLITIEALMDALLHSFADLFEEPCGLPPPRRHDHRIHLLPGSTPVAVDPIATRNSRRTRSSADARRCWRSALFGSTSLFSSPVLLVCKADKTWRFCVDYCELNMKTVRNKFPNPLVN